MLSASTSAAVAPLTASALLKADAAARARSGSATGGSLHSRAAVIPVSAAPPSSTAPSAPSSLAPSPSPAFDRVGRLRRLHSMCLSSAESSSAVSASELLVTLSYLSRSLSPDEAEAVRRLLEAHDPAAALPMKAFQLLLQDCLDREEGARAEEAEEEANRRFVSFVLDRLRVRLSESAAASAAEVQGSLSAAASEVAAVKRQLRLAEQGSRVLAEKVERLTLHCQRVEEDNGRLAALSASAVREHSSEAEVAQSLQSSLDQHRTTAARLTAALTANEALLARERGELQHAMAVLQMERASKVALSQEAMLLKEQVQALQVGRSSELRQVLKRKKEAMAAIMDSHRYTKEIKRQAERVPVLEAELTASKAVVAKQADDIAEYQRLLSGWKGGLDGLPLNRSRPAFSLCDDLDEDDGGVGVQGSASRGHSRRASAADFAATVHRLSRRPSAAHPAIEELAVLRVDFAAAEKSALELRGHRDALLLSLASFTAEKEEVEHRVEDQRGQLQALKAELQAKEELLDAQRREAEQRRLQWREDQAALEVQQQRLRCQVEEAQARTEQLSAALQRATAERDRALADVAGARKEAEAAEAARLALLSSSSSHDVDQQQRLTALTTEVASLSAQLAASQSALQRCQLLYEPALAELEAAQQRERQWQAERAELTAEVERLQGLLSALQAQVDSHVCPAIAVTVGGCTCGLLSVGSLEGGRPLQLQPGHSPQEADLQATPAPSVAALVQALPPPSSAPLPWPVVSLTPGQQVEVDCYSRYVNRHLQGDEALRHLLPLQEGSSELLVKVRDGLLLAQLLNHAVPGLIDSRALNRRPPASSSALSWQAVVQNLNLVISAAKAVGLTMRQQRRLTGGGAKGPAGLHPPPAFTPLTVVDDDGGDDVGSQPSSSPASPLLAGGARHSAGTVLVTAAATLTPPTFLRVGRGRTVSGASPLTPVDVEGEEADDGRGGEGEGWTRRRADSSLPPLDSDGPGEEGSQSPRPSLGSSPPASASSSRALDVSSSALQLMESSQPELVLDFVHQIVRLALLAPLDVAREPRLRFLAAVEPPIPSAAVSALTAEQLLDRWLRFTLPDSRPHSLTEDLRDGRLLTALMDRLHPNTRPSADADGAKGRSGSSPSPLDSALSRLEAAGVPHFHSAAALSGSHPRLQTLLLACVFGHAHGLPPLASSSGAALSSSAASTTAALHLSSGDAGLSAELDEGSREERAFRMWMNSAGIEGVYVHSLVADCRDGLVLLRLIDWVERGSVDWKAVELQPTNKFKAVSNCNLALRLCKERLHASLVGIGGEDIHDGSQKLILAVIWQLVRYNAIKKLETIRQHNRAASEAGGPVGGSRRLTDGDLLSWANAAVQAHPHPDCSGRHACSLRSWRDAACTTALFLFNLLHTLNAAVVDWTQVAMGKEGMLSDVDPTLGLPIAERLSNASYAISVARKLGAEAFLMPEDIVECKPKMILLFVGSCMQIQQEQLQQQRP